MKIIIEVDPTMKKEYPSADYLEDVAEAISDTPTKKLESNPVVLTGDLAYYKITVETD